jgi:ribosomal protein S27AE
MSSLTAFSLAEKDNLRDVEITKVNKWAPKCPNCGTKMTFALYEFSKGPPIENEVF